MAAPLIETSLTQKESAMTNTMTNPRHATITEHELFAQFLQTEIPATKSMFGEPARTYKPDDWLRDPGDYGVLHDLVNSCAEDLANSTAPETDLEILISELRNYSSMVEIVLYDFRAVKAICKPRCEDDGSCPRAWCSWVS
jgi:hypothetical protein